MSNEKIIKLINITYNLLKDEHKKALKKALDNYTDERANGYACGLAYALGAVSVIATEVNDDE